MKRGMCRSGQALTSRETLSDSVTNHSRYSLSGDWLMASQHHVFAHVVNVGHPASDFNRRETLLLDYVRL